MVFSSLIFLMIFLPLLLIIYYITPSKKSFTLKNIMQDFVKNGGAIFYSTHVLEVAEKLCNKVIMIKNGEIIKQGTMKDIKADKSLEEVFFENRRRGKQQLYGGFDSN